MVRLKWVAVALVSVVVWLAGQWPDGRLHLVFCDVGQGDAILMVKGEVQVLVDTGPSADKILECLSEYLPFWDRTLELVAISHDQKDHGGALGEIMRRYRVGEVIQDRLVAGDAVRVGDLYFDILYPRVRERVNDPNELSLVMKLKFGEFEALLTGDIGEGQEQALLAELGEVEVLKVAHHGSKYSSSQSFLERVRPKLAVVQVGKNNYGHPTAEVLERLKVLGVRVMRNDQDGTVEIVSNGKTWWVRTSRWD